MRIGQLGKNQSSFLHVNASHRLLVARHYIPFLTLVLLIVLWQAVVSLAIYPTFIVPSPSSVLEKWIAVIADGTLWRHTTATLANVVAGLALGLTMGLGLGYLLAKSPVLRESLSPIIVAVQSTPVVAYAPLLVIWFGSGPSSKIVTCALIVFFPMLINTIVGVQNVPQGLRDVMATMRATRWQTFSKLEVPAAMPILMSALKISATLSVIGAVVGEFISANVGLGFLINVARSQYDTSLVFVAVGTLTIVARLIYALATAVEHKLLAWQDRARRQ